MKSPLRFALNRVRELCAAQGITVLSINALYPFNVWNDERRAQIDTLLSSGYGGYLSFEPFATSVHELADIQQALGASIAHLQKR